MQADMKLHSKQYLGPTEESKREHSHIDMLCLSCRRTFASQCLEYLSENILIHSRVWQLDGTLTENCR
jgi:hypothetical protein